MYKFYVNEIGNANKTQESNNFIMIKKMRDNFQNIFFFYKYYVINIDRKLVLCY